MNEIKMNSDKHNCEKLNIEQSDVETISANTEDSLLNTRTNSETKDISHSGDEKRCCPEKKANCCRSCCGLTTGFLFTIWAILLFVWTPFTIMMEQRLEMIPGLPAFEWWKTPPDNVLMKVHVFNVTNAESFLDGTHEKLLVEDVGPIIYSERLLHVDVEFNENNTMSYTTKRTPHYLPELNTVDLNATIVVPNYAVLGMASYLHDYSFLTKYGFNLLRRGTGSRAFVNLTIYDFLWNFTDPILSVAKHLAPHVVDDDNMGMLNTIYKNLDGRCTVYIGNKNGHHKFFGIDKYNGSMYLPGHGEKCKETLVNSSEGALYPQYLTKNTSLGYWRPTLCQVVPLYYEEDVFLEDYGINTYKYIKDKYTYYRNSNLTNDCHKGNPVLPDGLADVSKCYKGFPMAASFPHYLYGDEVLQSYVDGLQPNASLHDSYTYIEPLTGIPIKGVARSQSNMIIRDMSPFQQDLHKFSNTAIPMFWIEFEQTGLPYYVHALLKFTVIILPKYQFWFTTTILIIGLSLLVIYIRRILKRRRRRENNYQQNTNLQFEQEMFLKKTPA